MPKPWLLCRIGGDGGGDDGEIELERRGEQKSAIHVCLAVFKFTTNGGKARGKNEKNENAEEIHDSTRKQEKCTEPASALLMHRPHGNAVVVGTVKVPSLEFLEGPKKRTHKSKMIERLQPGKRQTRFQANDVHRNLETLTDSELILQAEIQKQHA